MKTLHNCIRLSNQTDYLFSPRQIGLNRRAMICRSSNSLIIPTLKVCKMHRITIVKMTYLHNRIHGSQQHVRSSSQHQLVHIFGMERSLILSLSLSNIYTQILMKLEISMGLVVCIYPSKESGVSCKSGPFSACQLKKIPRRTPYFLFVSVNFFQLSVEMSLDIN